MRIVTTDMPTLISSWSYAQPSPRITSAIIHSPQQRDTTYPNFPPVLTFIGVLLGTPPPPLPPSPLTVSVLRQLSAPELSVDPCLCPSPFAFFEADLVGLL